MADDRRADHQYSVNRPPDAKRPVVIHPHGGRPPSVVAGHTTTLAHMPQSDSTGRRSTPTPPPRRPSPAPVRVGGGKPATFHIQLPGSNEVIPVHIPVQGGAQVTANLARPASRGSPSAGAYVLHTGVVMPGGNVITIPTTLAATQAQRRTPSPKVATSVRTEIIGQQRLTPPPPSTSRASPVMFHHQGVVAGASATLLAPPNGGNRSSSPRSSAMTAAQVPQLLITPAHAQLLGVTTATTLNPAQQALAAQKLAAQLELNKVQQQQHHLAIAANMITTSAAAIANSNLSQKVLSSTIARVTPTERVVGAVSVGQQRPRSVPSMVNHPAATAESLTQPAPTHHSSTTATHSTSSATTVPHRKDGAVGVAVRRLPVNTEPQRFFASSHPTVPNSSEVSWSSSTSTTTSSRPQRPASHPNLPVTTKSSNLRQPHELSGTTVVVAQRTGVVPNGIDMTNANGDAHKPLTQHSDSRPRTTSPANSHAQSSNHQHTLVSQSSLTPYQQLLLQQQNQQQHQQKPHRVHHHSHRLAAKSHSEIPRSMVNHNTDNEVPMPKLVPEKSIPPLISTKDKSQDPQANIKQEQVQMERLISPFNMRVQNLDNFPASQSTYRANYRSQAFAIHRAKSFQNAVQRARTGSITNAAKSLDLLRQNLQKHINQEIDHIIQRYMTYFTPGIRNIRTNNGESTVTDDHVLAVCRQILEEAKKMYGDGQAPTGGSEVKMETDRSRSPSNNLRENQDVRAKKINLFNVPKRRGSSDSDVSIPKKKKKGRPPLYNSASGRNTPSKPGKAQEHVKREGPKWDPERLDETTKFIMGAKANKALGLGNTRGRLYIKHPEVFKYSGDQDDKQWLFEHQHMPATGGKAYMLAEEDIRELAMTDEYKANPGLLLDEIHGFTVPPWLIEKMKKQMQAMRSDQPKVTKNRSRSATPNATTQENTALGADPPLPFSTMSDQIRTDNVPSPSQSLDLLGVDGDDVDLQDVSPYNMTGGFASMSPGPASISPAPSDLDGLDDDTTPFGTTD